MSQKSKVFAAANAISARGEPITQIAVRAEMGGGSFSTIGPLVKEWRIENPQIARAINDVDAEAPEAVQKIAAELVRRVWIEAQSAASVALETMRQDVEDLKAEAAAEIAETVEAMKVLEAERDDALIKAQEFENHWGAALSDLTGADTALEEAREQIVNEAARADLAERELKRADAAKIEADERAALSQALRESAVADAKAERDAAMADAKDERQEAIRARDEAREQIAALQARLEDERSRNQGDVVSLREQVAALTAQRDDANTRAEVAEAARVQMEAALSSVEAKAAGRGVKSKTAPAV